MIDEVGSYARIFVTEEIFDLFTILLVEELALTSWSFTFPGVDGIGDIVRNPDPERAAVLACRNMEIADPRFSF
jgi:hypothetical protein